jgi:hypothetical protein
MRVLRLRPARGLAFPERDEIGMNRYRALGLLFEHDPFGKPLHTFPDHALEHDVIRLKRHRALALCLSMIFSENRFPLFRIML